LPFKNKYSTYRGSASAGMTVLKFYDHRGVSLLRIIQLSEKDANKVNQTVIMEPAEVNTTVSYDFEGERFQFINQEDREGYRLMTIKDNAQDKEYAIIKPTTQNGYYIISKDGKSSFGYFNDEGNFVVERYDEKADKVISDVYRLNKKDLKSKNK